MRHEGHADFCSWQLQPVQADLWSRSAAPDAISAEDAFNAMDTNKDGLIKVRFATLYSISTAGTLLRTRIDEATLCQDMVCFLLTLVR